MKLEKLSVSDIDKDFVNELFENKFFNEFIGETIGIVRDLDSSEFGDWTSSGYVDNDMAVDFCDIEIDTKDIYFDEIFINGHVTVETSIEVYGYNGVRDPGEDKYFFINSGSLSIRYNYSFAITNESKPYGLVLDVASYDSNIKEKESIDFD